MPLDEVQNDLSRLTEWILRYLGLQQISLLFTLCVHVTMCACVPLRGRLVCVNHLPMFQGLRIFSVLPAWCVHVGLYENYAMWGDCHNTTSISKGIEYEGVHAHRHSCA